MKLNLKRLHRTKNSTIGELSIDGKFECYVLEDVDRDLNRDGDLKDAGEQKVFGKTAIPSGTYQVVITMSNRFKKLLPLLINVPDYAGVRIHTGNTAIDTEGCLIVGKERDIDVVMQSKVAMNAFMPKLTEGLKKGDVFITIE